MAVDHKPTFTEIRDAYNNAVNEMNDLGDQIEEARNRPAPKEQQEREELEQHIEELEARWYDAVSQVELREEQLKKRESLDRARAQFKPVVVPDKSRLSVSEPDIYTKGGRSFFADMLNSRVNGDPEARERIEKHQRLAVEQRAVTTATVGGLIPPQYMLGLYAKAARNGRVYADQANGSPLPDTGMSVIIPRITTATAAGVQASENSTVTTQDPAETDLTVPVRTLAGYLPVSRQALERAAYDDAILFEDLIARYFALLDTQCLNGSGSSGQILGALNTSGIATSAATTLTVAGVYPKIADVIQQINTNVGGIGYVPDKIIMHPRRWGFFNAAFDGQGRPLMVPQNVVSAASVMAFNTAAEGDPTAYGPVGSMLGCAVYTDANIPTTLGSGTNEDRIIVQASPVVHLFERAGDPVTLSFEQQAGTSLQVQLVVYGYAAFTAGRYPGATGVVTGLTPPSF